MPEEIQSALGSSTSGRLIVSKSKSDATDAALFMDAYGVTERGNFEGTNILPRLRDTDVLAAMHKLDASSIQRKLDDARSKLLMARERRIKPARYEKILTGWNGLMLAAFAQAARVFAGRQSPVTGPKYEEIARRNAGFLLENLRDGNGRRVL